MRLALAPMVCVLLALLAGVAIGSAQAQSAVTPTPRPAVQHGLDLVLVPSGCFAMGSASGDNDEQPVHTVCLTDFYIGRTEVTNAQYASCVQARACLPPHDRAAYDNPALANHPVVMVDWFMANAYAIWHGCHLPTEAEWEFAARGPASNRYPWGDKFDPTRLNFCDSNCPYDWGTGTADDGFRTTAPVGSYPQGVSWVGAFDLLGNVWEWTADWYQPATYAQRGDHAVNPPGPSSGWGRVVRGGSYASASTYTRAASRDWDSPHLRFRVVGFRIACDVTTADPTDTPPTNNRR